MAKKARSVLSRQKPRRGKPAGFWDKLKSSTFRLAVFALFTTALFAIYLGRARPKHANPSTESANWRVNLKLADDTPLPDEAQEAIIDTALKSLGPGSKSDLRRTAQAIQQLGSYADVHVVRLGLNQVAIQVRQRVPAFCIDADRVRFVAKTGEVFGEVDRTSDFCAGHMLTGVFDSHRRFTFLADQTLVLDEDEKALLREALDLIREAEVRHLSFSHFDVKKYRGFFLTLKPGETEVALGRAPFATKLSKLQEILSKHADRHEQVSRIELDYQGKAFVKLKKM